MIQEPEIPDLGPPDEGDRLVADLLTTPTGVMGHLGEFGTRFIEKPRKFVPVLDTVMDGVDIAKLIKASERQGEGRETQKDRDRIYSFLIEANRTDIPWSGKMGSMVGEIPAFAVEFGLTAGAGAVGTRLTRQAVAKILRRNLNNHLGRTTRKALRDTVGSKTAMRLTGEGFGRLFLHPIGHIHALKATTAAMYKRGLELTEDEAGFLSTSIADSMPGFVEALFKHGYPEAWIELFSESTGPALRMLPGTVTAQAALSHLVSKFVPKSELRDFARRVAQKGGWHGLLEEWGEEQVARVLRSMLTDQTWIEGFPLVLQGKLEEAGIELGGLALGGGLLHAGGALGGAAKGLTTQRIGAEADEATPEQQAASLKAVIGATDRILEREDLEPEQREELEASKEEMEGILEEVEAEAEEPTEPTEPPSEPPATGEEGSPPVDEEGGPSEDREAELQAKAEAGTLTPKEWDELFGADEEPLTTETSDEPPPTTEQPSPPDAEEPPLPAEPLAEGEGTPVEPSESFDDFTASMNPRLAARTRRTLEVQRGVRGKFGRRGDLIRELVEEGYRIEVREDGSRRLAKEGSFFLEKDLTKTGFDYAEFLTKPETPPEEPAPEPAPTTEEPEASPTPAPSGEPVTIKLTEPQASALDMRDWSDEPVMQRLWKGGKKLTLTPGEADALLSELMDAVNAEDAQAISKAEDPEMRKHARKAARSLTRIQDKIIKAMQAAQQAQPAAEPVPEPEPAPQPEPPEGPYRAPHHTISDLRQVQGEVYRAAGGTLHLQDAEDFKQSVILEIHRLVTAMHGQNPPRVTFTHSPWAMKTQRGRERAADIEFKFGAGGRIDIAAEEARKQPERPHPSLAATHKGTFYWDKHADAEAWGDAHGWPTDRIIQTGRGWAIQAGISGPYAGPEQLAPPAQEAPVEPTPEEPEAEPEAPVVITPFEEHAPKYSGMKKGWSGNMLFRDLDKGELGDWISDGRVLVRRDWIQRRKKLWDKENDLGRRHSDELAEKVIDRKSPTTVGTVVGVTTPEEHTDLAIIQFNDGAEHTLINADFLRVLDRDGSGWDEIRVVDKQKPVQFHQGGEIVAVVMPITRDVDDISKALGDAPKASKVGRKRKAPPKPKPKEPEVERKPHKLYTLKNYRKPYGGLSGAYGGNILHKDIDETTAAGEEAKPPETWVSDGKMLVRIDAIKKRLKGWMKPAAASRQIKSGPWVVRRYDEDKAAKLADYDGPTRGSGNLLGVLLADESKGRDVPVAVLEDGAGGDLVFLPADSLYVINRDIGEIDSYRLRPDNDGTYGKGPVDLNRNHGLVAVVMPVQVKLDAADKALIGRTDFEAEDRADEARLGRGAKKEARRDRRGRGQMGFPGFPEEPAPAEVPIGRGLKGKLVSDAKPEEIEALPDIMAALAKITSAGRLEVAKRKTEDPESAKRRADLAKARGVEPIPFAELQKRRRKAAKGRAVPSRVGMGGSGALGQMSPSTEVIRLQKANDIPVNTHEIGHALEKIVFGWKKGGPWKKPMATGKVQRELLALGKALYGDTKPYGGYKREGFAEFLRLWLTAPTALPGAAPETTAWFNGTFLKTYPAVREEMEKSRKMITDYRMAGSYARGRKAIAPAKTTKQKVTDSIKRTVSIRTWYEMADDLRKLMEQAEIQEGVRRPPEMDANLLFQGYRLAQTPRVKYMLEKGMLDIHGLQVEGVRPLNDIAPLVEKDPYGFVVYMHALRAKALWEDPKGKPRDAGVSYEDALQNIEELEQKHPRFPEAAQIAYAWQDGILNYMAQASPTFAEIVGRMKARDPGFYIPLHREFREVDSIYAGRGRGPSGAMEAAGASRIAKRLKGSGRRVLNPINQMIAQAEHMLLLAHQRVVLDAIIDLGNIEGMGQFVEEIPRPKLPAATVSVENLLNRLKREAQGEKIDVELTREGEPVDEEELERLLEQSVTFFTPATVPNGDRPVIPILTEGGLKWYWLDSDVYTTLKGMDREPLPLQNTAALGGLVRFTAWTARAKRLGTTGLRAAFSLIRNPAKDLPQFWMFSQSTAGSWRLLAAWFEMQARSAANALTGKGGGEFLDLWERLGGPMAQPLGQDMPSAARAADEVIGGKRFKLIRPGRMYDKLVQLLQFTEIAPRAAEMKLLARDLGWKPGQDLDKFIRSTGAMRASIRLLLGGKRVTVDFTGAGSASRVANQVIPFFSATLGGHRAFYRAAKHHPWTFISRMAQVTAATLGLWWLIKDEEWFRDMPLREKFNNWYIPAKWFGGEEDTIVSIPRPFEIGVLGAALPEALADAAYHEDPSFVTGWLGHFIKSTSPDFEPVPLAEGIDQALNLDRYWERPIVPASMDRRFAEEQFDEYTTSASIFIGKVLGWSPKRIDHAFRGAFGGAGMGVLRTPDWLMGRGGNVDREREPSDVPVLGTVFLRGGAGGRRSRAVDKLFDEVELAVKIQHSPTRTESAKERSRRLMLQNVAQAIGRLSWARSHTDSIEARSALSREMRKYAEEALKNDMSEAKARRLRKRAQRKKEALERSLR